MIPVILGVRSEENVALKDMWNAFVGKPKEPTADETAMAIVQSDLFPVVEIPETALERYKKVPLEEIGALGAAFAQLPEEARTVVQTTTKRLGTGEKLYVGINPKGVSGYLQQNALGLNGNIMQVNEQGKNVITGRMRFKEVPLQMTETSVTTMPLDPTMMVVAVAVMAINQKLDSIQTSVEEVLQFLHEDKQAGQRGRLNRLAEIAEEFKKDCANTALMNQRNIEVQAIQTKAMENIEFYQTRINSALQKEKLIHMDGDAQKMSAEVTKSFAEYQLACYTYGYCAFLDIMLRKDYRDTALQSAVDKLTAMRTRYDGLFDKCRSQLSSYQRNTIESKLVGGIGFAAKGLGKAIGSIPVIKEGPVDEALIAAGKSISSMKRHSLHKKLEAVDVFASSRMEPFVESLQTVNAMHNKSDAMITDGESLYLLTE